MTVQAMPQLSADVPSRQGTCLTTGCERARIPMSPNGTVHSHCTACEARLLREAFGPQSWHDRARVNELPSLVVGGAPLAAPAAGAHSPLGSGRSGETRGLTRVESAA